jgi:hypothetical protein
MKPVVDTITNEYNSPTSNQVTSNHQQQPNGLSHRMSRSASVDRNSSSSYFSQSRPNGHTNSYSRFTTYKQNGNESIDSTPIIEIPITNENGLATSKSVDDLTIKNGSHTIEINGITNSSHTVENNEIINGSSPPNSRPPTILQTRRS